MAVLRVSPRRTSRFNHIVSCLRESNVEMPASYQSNASSAHFWHSMRHNLENSIHRIIREVSLRNLGEINVAGQARTAVDVGARRRNSTSDSATVWPRPAVVVDREPCHPCPDRRLPGDAGP